MLETRLKPKLIILNKVKTVPNQYNIPNITYTLLNNRLGTEVSSHTLIAHQP